MKKKGNNLTFLFLVICVCLLFISSCKKEDNSDDDSTVKDVDGNVYNTVTIGTQTWMAENLKVTQFNDGTSIPNIIDDFEWSNLNTGAFCNYYNQDINAKTYGRLYNWYAVNSGKLAPKGWHIPSETEWETLITFLGGDSLSSHKMIETDNNHWDAPSIDADNSSGFSALPAGLRAVGGNFMQLRSIGYWWSSTEENIYKAKYIIINHTPDIFIDYTLKQTGFSIRCVKD